MFEQAFKNIDDVGMRKVDEIRANKALHRTARGQEMNSRRSGGLESLEGTELPLPA